MRKLDRTVSNHGTDSKGPPGKRTLAFRPSASAFTFVDSMPPPRRDRARSSSAGDGSGGQSSSRGSSRVGRSQSSRRVGESIGHGGGRFTVRMDVEVGGRRWGLGRGRGACRRREIGRELVGGFEDCSLLCRGWCCPRRPSRSGAALHGARDERGTAGGW